jgi:hypothetical protein
MRKGSVLVLVVVLGAFAAELLTHVGTPASADPPTAAWKIVGQLEEACSCSAACPCWFNSKPTRMNCSGGEFVFIQKGSFGDVKLDGLAVGSMSQSPDGKGMMESFGSWNFNYYYIDEKATPEQRDALKAIAKTVLAPNASPKEEIRYVPLTRTITGNEHKISLGKYGQFSGHLIEGGLGGAVKITNPPGADPLHQEYSQGQTTTMAFNDASQDWNFQGSNYMYGTFELDDKQYEKFAAGLAQKMKDMKH